MTSHEQSEKKSPISRRGLLCGAVGTAAAIAGGLLMNCGDESQRILSVETNASKLDLDWAYEIYGQARDMFRQCIEEAPVFTSEIPPILPPPTSVSVSRDGGRRGFMTGGALLRKAGHSERAVIGTGVSSDLGDDSRVRIAVAFELLAGKPEAKIAELMAVWGVSRRGLPTERAFRNILYEIDPEELMLSFVPVSQRQPTAPTSEQPYEWTAMLPGMESFNVIQQVIGAAGGSSPEVLLPTPKVLDRVSEQLAAVRDAFGRAGFL
ncbi:hypothetical protein QTN79_00415 [Candidatus Saccharibacteria bacterium oral taxon 488]